MCIKGGDIVNGYERIIKMMREQGAAYNGPSLQLGEMSSKTVCMVGDLKLEKDDYLISQHLTEHEITIEEPGYNKKTVKVYSRLKKGDIVLVQRISDEQYVIIERLVEL